MGKIHFITGNEAVIEGAITAGVRFFAGYPITPATEIAEHAAKRLPQVGGKFIQMEDEIGSISAVLGASVGGLKAMTATSGPGMSLYSENIGQAIVAEIPSIIVDVQRTGPGTGSITPAQQDIMQARWGTHGDATGIALAPSSVQEVYDLMIKAVNLSERFRVPVTILMETFLGHLTERVIFKEPSEINLVERPKPRVPPEKYRCYEPDERGVPAMADFGSRYRSKFLGNMHNEEGKYSRDPKVFDTLIRRLQKKVTDYPEEYESVEEIGLENADTAIFVCGSPSRSAKEAIKYLRNEKIHVGVIRPITIWPFPHRIVSRLAEKVKHFLVVEMNLGQLLVEVERTIFGRAQVSFLGDVTGMMISPEAIYNKVKEVLD